MMTFVQEQNRGYTLGASDYLTKPVDRQQLGEVLQRHISQSPGGETPGGEILVVDDDPMTRRLMRDQLAMSAYGVREAASGQDALSQMETFRPSMIILDLLMPTMNGFEFLHHLKQQSEYQDIPVIVMTAKDLSPAERSSLTDNVQKVFCKGVCDRHILLTNVHQFLAGALSQPPPTAPAQSPVEPWASNVCFSSSARVASRLSSTGTASRAKPQPLTPADAADRRPNSA